MNSPLALVFHDPQALWLLALLPLALWIRGRRGLPAVRFAALAVWPDAQRVGTLRSRLTLLPVVLQCVGLALVLTALARPQRVESLPREIAGIDIFLCLDRSSSMAATDLDDRRTRLEVAREAAAAFVTARPQDRIGLLTFARFPDLLCPLTLDHRALAQFLEQVELVPEDDPEDVTGIGGAVGRAAQLLQSSTAPSKVVILLTDGEENVATDQTPDEIGPLRAARLCEALGVRVYTIAAGLGLRDASGRWHPVDTRQVQRTAELTGGAFYKVQEATALHDVYATIDLLEKAPFQDPGRRLVDVFLGWLLAGGALWLLGQVLGRTWLGGLP